MKTFISSKTIIFILFIFSIQLFGMTPEETKTARKTWLKGYDYYEKGEKALENEQLRESHTLLKESLRIFNNIKNKYPGWSSSMIEYRIKLCENKIEQIKKILAKKNIKLTSNDVDKENLILKNRLSELEDELKKTKRKLSITLSSLESARREAARNHNSSGEIQKIIKEKTDLEKRYALLLERNKKLQIESGKETVETSKESKKELDAALLEIEALKKDKEIILKKLIQEQKRFDRVANDNTQLRYENKLLLQNDKKTKKIVEELNGKLSEHNEIIARWEKEKADFGSVIDEKNKAIAESKSEIKTLKEKLDEVRNNPDKNTITKQLENENNLLKKDMELVHLKLAKELKQKKNLKEENDVLTQRVERLEKSLSTSLQGNNSTKNNISSLEEKIIISDTIIQKQEKALAEQKAENEKIRKELDQIVEKYKNIDKKEKEFIALANDSIKIENKNRALKSELKKVKKEKEDLSEEIKESEIRMVQLEKQMNQIISDNSNTEKKFLTVKADFEQQVKSLNKRNSNLKSDLETNRKKLMMVTDELVAVNSQLSEKAEIIKGLKKDLEKSNSYMQQVKIIKEPEIITKDPDNSNEVAIMEKGTETVQKDPIDVNPNNTSVKNPEQVKKMLDSALSAEKNGKKEAAIWYYEKVLKEEPENNRALTRLAYIYAAKGNYEEAVDLLKKGLKVTPEDIEKMQTLTYCYIKQKEFDLALGIAANTNAQDPKNPKTLKFLGIIYNNLGLKKAAEKQFRQSFKIDPTSADTAFNAAVLLTGIKGRIQEAKLWYDKAIQLGAERDPGMEKILKTAK